MEDAYRYLVYLRDEVAPYGIYATRLQITENGDAVFYNQKETEAGFVEYVISMLGAGTWKSIGACPRDL